MEITSGQPNITLGNGSNDGFGNGWGIMFLAFLAMMGGGFGGYGRSCNVPNNIATSDTVNNAVQFDLLQNQNRDIMSGINQAEGRTTQYINDRYSELQRDIAANAVTLANMQAHQSECCCAIKQEIAAQTLNFTQQMAAMNLEAEKRFNAINSKMDQQEIQRLRDEVTNLRCDMRMQGVVRYPNGFTYNAGNSPFCGCNCNGFIA